MQKRISLGRLRSASLRGKLIRTLLIWIAVPALLLSIYLTLVVVNLSRNNAEKAAQQIATQLGARIATFVQDIRSLSLHAVYGPVVQDFILGDAEREEDVISILRQIVEIKNKSVSLYLYPLDTRIPSVLINYRHLIDYSYTVRQDSAVQGLFESNTPFGAAFTRNDPQVAAAGNPVISIYRLVHNVDTGKLAGILLINVPFETLDATFYGTAALQNAGVRIRDASGRILYEQIGRPQAAGGEITTSVEISGTGLELSLSISRDQLSLGFQTLSFGIVIPVLVITVLILFLSFMIPAFITRPVSALMNNIEQIKAGEFQLSSGYISDDEIGKLHQSFRDMAVELDKMIKKVAEEEKLRSEAVVYALQSQINPHFLFNTLNSVKWLSHIHGSPAIEEVSDCLMKMMSYALEHPEQMVHLKDELTNIRYYLRIQEIRYFHAVQTEIYCSPDLEETTMPKITLQPIIENIFKHAFTDMYDGNSIRIVCVRDGDDVVISIIDNAGNLKADQYEQLNRRLNCLLATEHVGILNVHNRIRGAFGGRYGLEIEVDEGISTTVSVRIPSDGTQDEYE